jgi:putative DeoR family transcriptional regulator (stage III sporulation protein D)
LSAYIIKRVLEVADHIIDTKDTIRETAKKFNISKSTVHKDLQERLKMINKEIHKKVNFIFENHIKTRNIKGGEATKQKYKNKEG